MGSKTILLLGLLAMVLLIASEVSARELSQTSGDKESEKTNGVDDAKHQGGGYGGGGYPGGGYGGNRGGYGGGHKGGGGGGGHKGGGGGGGGGGGHKGGGGGGGGHKGGGGGGGCRYGCCGRSYNRGRCRCCTYAGEAVDAEPEAKPHN